MTMEKLWRLTPNRLKYSLIMLLALSLAAVSLILFLIIAHNQPLALPAPSGPYPVGRLALNWTDTAHPDPLADQSSGSPPVMLRKLPIWIWYPAASSGATPAPYLPPAWTTVRDKDQGIGVLLESNFSRIQTHSYEGVPLSAAPRAFPVLIMEPGMGPMTTDYTILVEALASQGYIVIGIHPTDTANWTVFLDGQSVPRSSIGSIPDSDTPEAADADGARILGVWVQDEIFVLDQLGRINADSSSPFYQRLDLDHIGLWGHSFGGATALAVCQQDARCQAGVDMDGTPFGAEREAPTPHPFMFIMEDYTQGCDRDCTLMRQAYLHVQPGAAYSLSVAGAGHFNFSDLPYRQQPVIRPLFTLAGFEGSIGPERALQITNAYLLGFFDHYLKSRPEGLLAGLSAAYPEIRFESR